MATLIENQNIAKRHKTSRSRHTNNSAGYNNEFMSLFDQKPSTKKKKKSSKRQTYSFPERDPRKNTRREKPFTPSKIRTNNNGGSGFTFRVPTLATLLVIAGVVITGLAVFSWEDVNLKVPEIYSFPVSESEKTDRRIAVYAENGITDILPANPGLQSSISEDDLAETEANNNHHGALITFEWHEHKVQRGETLSEIAQKFNISYGTIVAINNIKNARRVPAGTLLRIPTIDGLLYEVKSGDSLSKISVMQNIPLNAILDVNDIRSDNIKEGEKIFLPGARMNDIDLRMSLGDLFMYPLQNKYITSHLA